ncbi:MAG: hypothetical protein RLZZ324_1290 [Candidatus Parcubacteria bacterium]|jgi:hypothetical protein
MDEASIFFPVRVEAYVRWFTALWVNEAQALLGLFTSALLIMILIAVIVAGFSKSAERYRTRSAARDYRGPRLVRRKGEDPYRFN